MKDFLKTFQIFKYAYTVKIYVVNWVKQNITYYNNVSYFMFRSEIDGHACVLRALCETSRKITPKENMLDEMVRTVFT